MPPTHPGPHVSLEVAVPAEVCPVCASRELVAGRLQGGGGRSGITSRFRPRGSRLFAPRRAVPLASRNAFWACAECGCVWSQLDPAELQGVLAARAPRSRAVADPDGARRRGTAALAAYAAALVAAAATGLWLFV